VLDAIAERRGYPATLQTDSGPEFTSRALDQWACEHQVELSFIEPGKPTQNAHIEAFNGRLPDACLNQHWFRMLPDARHLVHRGQVHSAAERYPHVTKNFDRETLCLARQGGGGTTTRRYRRCHHHRYNR
jgi:putative transposase